MYGFELVWVIFAIHLIKYPFFEFAPRYAASTGESLLHGYNRLGKWAVYMYMILTIATMFALQAAVTLVTAGLLSYIFPNSFDSVGWSGIILIVLVLIVMIGKFSWLDKIIKFVIIILALSTLIAVFATLSNGFHPNPEYSNSFNWNFGDIAFLIAFAGWMPTAIDVSVWHSFWTLARKKDSGYSPKLKEVLLDFNVGYIGTAVLAFGFLSLGALVMYGSGEQFSASGTQFAGQLINLYTSSLGPWAFVLISVAAIATMFSTTLTCLDAYPRVLKPATEMIFPKYESKKEFNWLSLLWLLIVAAGAFIIIKYFVASMRSMVDIVTTMSFITAPILGWLNYKVVTAPNMPEEAKPKTWLRILSWFGLFVLSAFSLYFLIWKFIIK